MVPVAAGQHPEQARDLEQREDHGDAERDGEWRVAEREQKGERGCQGGPPFGLSGEGYTNGRLPGEGRERALYTQELGMFQD
jgi:hypothetical protein